jgi:hypothetical protein
MPAVSKAQQRFMGMVHAVQKGDMEAPSKEVEKAADTLSDKDAKDYASTSHKGLPNKKENMKITKERLKELVKEVMTEESEYQAFFQKALDKAGKGITDMSDDEKKAFFNKIDAAWNGKGEKNEELTGDQHKLDVDKDGDIEGDDLADLRAGKKADEAMELPAAQLPSAVKSKLMMAIDKIKDSKLTYNQKIQVIGKVMDSLGVDKGEFNKMSSKLKGTMESSIKEESPCWKGYQQIGMKEKGGKQVPNCVPEGKMNEAVSPKDMDKIKAAVEAAKSFMSVGAELKKLGMKYTFATEPLAIYIIQPTPNNKVAIVNKRYASKPDFVVGDIAVGIMEGILKEDYDGPVVIKTGDKNTFKVGEKVTFDDKGKKREYKVVHSKGNGDFTLKLVESVNEAASIYKDWDEFVNPHYILVTLKNGKKLKIEKKNVKGGTNVYHAILKAFNDDNYEITNKVVSGMLDRLGESVNEGLWPKSKLPQSFQFALAPELKKNFKGIFYSIGDDIYHNDKKVLSVDGDRDSVNSIIAKLKKIVK